MAALQRKTGAACALAAWTGSGGNGGPLILSVTTARRVYSETWGPGAFDLGVKNAMPVQGLPNHTSECDEWGIERGERCGAILQNETGNLEKLPLGADWSHHRRLAVDA